MLQCQCPACSKQRWQSARSSAMQQQGPSCCHAHMQRSVDRLGHAIEAAEEEMEAALRRTTEVHKSQLRQKEVCTAWLGSCSRGSLLGGCRVAQVPIHSVGTFPVFYLKCPVKYGYNNLDKI